MLRPRSNVSSILFSPSAFSIPPIFLFCNGVHFIRRTNTVRKVKIYAPHRHSSAVLSTFCIRFFPSSISPSFHLVSILSTCPSVCSHGTGEPITRFSHCLLRTLIRTHTTTPAPLHGNLACHAHQSNRLCCKMAVTTATSRSWWSALIEYKSCKKKTPTPENKRE